MKFKFSSIHSGHYSINKLANDIWYMAQCPKKQAFKEAKQWMYEEEKSNRELEKESRNG